MIPAGVNRVIMETTVSWNVKKVSLVLSAKESASVLTMQHVTRRTAHATVCQGG